MPELIEALPEEERFAALNEARRSDESLPDTRSDTESQQESSRPRDSRREHISFAVGLLMFGVAGIFDLFQGIFGPVGFIVNPVFSLIGMLIFFLWFHSHGLQYKNTRILSRLHVVNLATFAIGLLPIFSMLPEMIGKVAIALFIDRRSL